MRLWFDWREQREPKNLMTKKIQTLRCKMKMGLLSRVQYSDINTMEREADKANEREGGAVGVVEGEKWIEISDFCLFVVKKDTILFLLFLPLSCWFLLLSAIVGLCRSEPLQCKGPTLNFLEVDSLFLGKIYYQSPMYNYFLKWVHRVTDNIFYQLGLQYIHKSSPCPLSTNMSTLIYTSQGPNWEKSKANMLSETIQPRIFIMLVTWLVQVPFESDSFFFCMFFKSIFVSKNYSSVFN